MKLTPYDRELGLDRTVTRRDFVYGSTLLLGTALAGCGSRDAGTSAYGGRDYAFSVGEGWYGPGGFGDYADSHGNTPGLVQAAHEIRAGRFDAASADATDSGEEYDLVIVGAGFAGLSAAHHFRRLHPSGRALVLDNHPIFGGEAKRNDFLVDGVHLSGPQGSNDCAVQAETGEPDDYFTALGIPHELRYVEPEGDARDLRIPLDNYEHMHWFHDDFDVGHFFSGAANPWVKDLWRSGMHEAPWRDDVRAAFARLRQAEADAPAGREPGPWLDSMTMKAYYEDVLGLPPEVTAYYDPIVASIIGLGCDATSAWWGRHFALPGFTRLERYDELVLHSFPGGNAAIARHFVKKLIPDAIPGDDFEDILFGSLQRDALDRPDNPVRMRLESTAVRVGHDGTPGSAERVVVSYVKDGRVYRVRAKGVVMASGGWVNRHVVDDLPASHHAAYESFLHSPVLVANVALTNWRFLAKLGVAAAIWQGGFGFTCNIRRPMIVGEKAQPLHPDEPIVLTFYVPIFKPGLPAKEQGVVGRTELLTTSFADYERQIREQMSLLFADAGFDAARDIAGVILNRWGHAYVNPGPGFLYGMDGAPAPPEVIREPVGRIAIGHSELRGHQNWTGACAEGRRAVEVLLEAGVV